jgi:hypothetical protein
LFADETRDSREGFNVRILPNSQILGTDAAFGCYSRRLRENERRTTDSAGTEMNEMPIRGKSIGARILAHGRNNDSIPQRDAANI